MKTLEYTVKENLKFKINRDTASTFSVEDADVLYRINIISSMLLVDIHNIDSSRLRITDDRKTVNFTPEMSKSITDNDDFLNGEYYVGNGFLYNYYKSSSESDVYILLGPEYKDNFANLMSNIDKRDDEISVKELCQYINIPDVTDIIEQYCYADKLLEVKTFDNTIQIIKQELHV